MTLTGNPFTALLTVPAAIAMGLGLLAVPAGFADAFFPDLDPDWPLSPVAAQAMLSTIAGGAMTALTLAYSLTLVVFTLAAGNIGPRLLKRFSTERANQVTAGLLGGTFLFALITLGAVTDESAPQIGTFAGLLFGVASVAQLIYFVRHVAQSVSVDDEVAEVTARLRHELRTLTEKVGDASSLPDEDDFQTVVRADLAGYVSLADTARLMDYARDADAVIRVERRAGDYVLKGAPLVSATRELPESISDRRNGVVGIEPARTDGGTAEFSINLLIEIALRALSPGINDTFSALAVAEMISGALAEVVDGPSGPALLSDAEGNVRVVLPGAEVGRLCAQAFHPLRRAARTNILMARGLAKVYTRLHTVANDDAKAVICQHGRLLLMELHAGDHLEHDVDDVTGLMPFLEEA